LATEEFKIKVTKEGDDVLRTLSKNLKDAKNDFLLMSQAGKSSADELKKAGEKVTALGTQLRNTKKEVNDLANATRTMSKYQLAEFAENLTIVSAGLLAAGTAVIEFGKKIYESAKSGAEFEVLYNHFVEVNGGINQATITLEQFRKASAGNLTDEQLVKYSNSMTALGFSTETTTKLLDIAEKQGDKTGVSFETANAGLQKFIVTGAKRGLVELGFNIGVVEKAMEKVSNKTTEQIGKLDELEQQTIRTDAITTLYGDTLDNINSKVGDNADKIASLGSAYENLKTIISVGVGSAFSQIASDIDLTTDSFKSSTESAKDWGESIGKAISDTFGYLTRGIKGLQDLEDARREKEINRAFSTPIPIINPDADIYPAEPEAMRIARLNRQSRDNTGSKTSGRSSEKEKEVEITNELIDTQKRLNDLLLKESTFIDKNTLAYFNYTQQLRELENQLSGLNLPMSTLTVNGSVQTLPGLTETGITPYGVNPLQADKAKSISETAEDVGTITGGISTAMNALGVGSDNFVGKMLAGFDSALGIIQAIKTVNTVLSFIPGFASGGNFSGGSPIMVGERGAELIFPNTSGYVMNNYNSMKYLNSNSQPIYVGVNLNSMDIYTTGRKEFNNLSSQKRIN